MPNPLSPARARDASPEDADWLAAFHEGTHEAMRRCYADSFAAVERAVGSVLSGADRETVVHEVFYRVIADGALRATFRGGSLRAWMATVGRNAAIDYWRRRRREVPSGTAGDLLEDAEDGSRFDARVEARLVVERFREMLPAKWRGVFETRFVAQLDQSEAARVLGIHRTTLLYREMRVRALLRKFVLTKEER